MSGSFLRHEHTEQDAGPNDEERNLPHVPLRTSLARSSSSVSSLGEDVCALVQDWDIDDDGRPETLRLLFATPRRWLRDGQTIRVEQAPTAFGRVSVRVHSRLSRGEVIAELEMPQRQPPPQTLLRIRLPEGWQVKSAQAGAQELNADAQGTVDVSGLKGKSIVRFRVERL